MHVELSDSAQADIDNIRSYLGPRSEKGLERVLTAIFTSIGQLEKFPFIGRKGRVEGTFEVFVPRTPFIVVYTVPNDFFVKVEAVLHTARAYPFDED